MALIKKLPPGKNRLLFYVGLDIAWSTGLKLFKLSSCEKL